jgi:3-hydroxyisobutyrate dehydrogenase-like beta-hydroxyacid dehydrogenase
MTEQRQGEQSMRHRTTTEAPVTVLGLGMMGSALAGAFLEAGHPTTVWNRSVEKAEPLLARGAKHAASLHDAVAASPLVVVCLTDYTAARAVLDQLDASLDGRVVVNMTSGTSQEAQEAAEWAQTRGAAYLDGAIMAVPQGIGTEDAAIIYSGPRSAFDRHEPTLQRLAANTAHLGEDPRLTALHEVAVLGIMWGALNGFLHGAAVLRAAGVDAAPFASLAAGGMGTIAGWLPGYAQQIDEEKYPALDATIDTHLAAMEHAVHETEALGVSTELPTFTKALADRAAAAGRGAEGYAALIEQFRAPTKAGS